MLRGRESKGRLRRNGSLRQFHGRINTIPSKYETIYLANTDSKSIRVPYAFGSSANRFDHETASVSFVVYSL